MNLALDCDETLLSTRLRQETLLNSILRAYGLEVPAYSVWDNRRSGKSIRESLELLEIDTNKAFEIASIWVKMIEDFYWLQFDTLFRNCLPTLNTIRSEGHKIIFLSARQIPQHLAAQLEIFGLLEKVDELAIVSPLNAAIEKARVLKDKSVDLFIGDTESDALASQISGVNFAAVFYGQRNRSALKNYKISYSLNHFSEVLDVVRLHNSRLADRET